MFQRQLLLTPLSGPESAGLLHSWTFVGSGSSVMGLVMEVPLRRSNHPTSSSPRMAVARIWALCLRSMSREADDATEVPTTDPRSRISVSPADESTAEHDVPEAVFFSRTPIDPPAIPTPGELGVEEKVRTLSPLGVMAHALPAVRVWLFVTTGGVAGVTSCTVLDAPVVSATHEVT